MTTDLRVPARNESEHYYLCSECGQAVDMRDLSQVFHHEEQDHQPIKADS